MGAFIFDTHCHWDHASLQALQPDLWQSCLAHNVQALLVPATQMQRFQTLVALCQQHHHWHLALGLHPYFVKQHQATDVALLCSAIAQHQPVAVGEIGLDWHLPEQTWAWQEFFFTQQLAIAKQHHLPVVVHVRQCHDKVIKLLRQHQFAEGGIIHAYSGNINQAHAYRNLGFKLGVGGTITYTRASKIRRVMAQLPLDSLVLETDAPDMPMAHQQDRLNRPDHLPYVVDVLAELKQIPAQSIIEQTHTNAMQVLRLSL